jgi:exosome complex RNA-binding protein Rrp4
MSIYKLIVDCGRMGDLNGVFEATPNQIQELMGKKVNFGEVLGKHSDVSVVIDENCVVHLTDDEEFIKKAKTYGLIPTGHNPFDYLE